MQKLPRPCKSGQKAGSLDRSIVNGDKNTGCSFFSAHYVVKIPYFAKSSFTDADTCSATKALVTNLQWLLGRKLAGRSSRQSPIDFRTIRPQLLQLVEGAPFSIENMHYESTVVE